MLSQNQEKSEQPIAYESHKLFPAKQKYVIHEKELLAIIMLLSFGIFILKVSYFSGIYQVSNNLSWRQAHWLEILQLYIFDIKYRSEKTNIVANTLSQQPHLANLSVITSYLKNFEKKYLENKYFVPIYKTLKNPS